MNFSLRSAIGVVLLSACSAMAQADPPNWVLVSDKNAFTPRDSCGELVYKDRLWLMGGWMDSFKDPPRDVWSSPDGKEWTLVTKEAAWRHSDFPMTVVFKDRMWSMGGWHGGRLPHASASDSVWSSTDGADWKLEAEHAGWSPRMAGGLLVFNDRIWLFGGVQKYYFGNDDDLKNDVWSSADGIKWEQATAKAPWSPRAYLQVAALNGRMYVFGGGNYLPNYQAKNDVWSSDDGANWTLETESAPWPPRIWFSTAVYRDRIWVLGGSSSSLVKTPAPNADGGEPKLVERRVWKNSNDVWTTKDGKTWTPFKTETIWKERHEHSCYVFRDKLWVVTGHAAPLQNDVWTLDVPADHFKD